MDRNEVLREALTCLKGLPRRECEIYYVAAFSSGAFRSLNWFEPAWEEALRWLPIVPRLVRTDLWPDEDKDDQQPEFSKSPIFGVDSPFTISPLEEESRESSEWHCVPAYYADESRPSSAAAADVRRLINVCNKALAALRQPDPHPFLRQIKDLRGIPTTELKFNSISFEWPLLLLYLGLHSKLGICQPSLAVVISEKNFNALKGEYSNASDSDLIARYLQEEPDLAVPMDQLQIVRFDNPVPKYIFIALFDQNLRDVSIAALDFLIKESATPVPHQDKRLGTLEPPPQRNAGSAETSVCSFIRTDEVYEVCFAEKRTQKHEKQSLGLPILDDLLHNPNRRRAVMHLAQLLVKGTVLDLAKVAAKPQEHAERSDLQQGNQDRQKDQKDAERYEARMQLKAYKSSKADVERELAEKPISKSRVAELEQLLDFYEDAIRKAQLALNRKTTHDPELAKERKRVYANIDRAIELFKLDNYAFYEHLRKHIHKNDGYCTYSPPDSIIWK